MHINEREDWAAKKKKYLGIFEKLITSRFESTLGPSGEDKETGDFLLYPA